MANAYEGRTRADATRHSAQLRARDAAVRRTRAIVVGDQIVVRPMMYVALSYDHRIVDGREAVQFLVKVKDCVETPERILLEI